MVDIYDVLLDEGNKDPIVLVDGNGRKTAFEQIAVIPYNEKLYCILKPIEKIENVAGDEAIVFFVDGQDVLAAETDELTAKAVFGEYCNLLDGNLQNK